MTSEKVTLDELAALEAKATPGPWEWWRDPGLTEDGVHAPALGKHEQGAIVDAVTICRGMTGPNREANAEFIAAARNALPGLIAAARERERLRVALDKVASDCEFLVRSSGGAQTHHVELLGRLLRAALAGKAIP